MNDHVEIFRYRAGSPSRMHNSIVSYTPDYGLVSNQITTNGSWWACLEYALVEMDPEYAKLPDNIWCTYQVDTSGVPPEILQEATGFYAASGAIRKERIERVIAFIKTNFDTHNHF